MKIRVESKAGIKEIELTGDYAVHQQGPLHILLEQDGTADGVGYYFTADGYYVAHVERNTSDTHMDSASQ